MRLLFILLLLIILPFRAFATQQISEVFIYKGKPHRLLATPLEKHPDRRSSRFRKIFQPRSTALWRGYVGTWQVVEGKLQLVKLLPDYNSKDHEAIPAHKIFKTKNFPVNATWYSGVLLVPIGKRLRNRFLFGTDIVYASMREKSLYITVKKGKVIQQQLVDNSNQTATRSIFDMERVNLADKPVKDDGNWYDARLINTPEFDNYKRSGKPFKTRFLYLYSSSKKYLLVIPPTPATDSLTIKTDTFPDPKLPARTPIEVEARFVKTGDKQKLEILKAKPLKPGESIHHKNFKPPSRK